MSGDLLSWCAALFLLAYLLDRARVYGRLVKRDERVYPPLHEVK